MYQRPRRRTDLRQQAPNRFLALRARFAGSVADVAGSIGVVLAAIVILLLVAGAA